MKKNFVIVCLILIITVSAVALVYSWQRNNDASENPNLILCENHIDLDLDMACDTCAKILSNDKNILPKYDLEEKEISYENTDGTITEISGKMPTEAKVKSTPVEKSTVLSMVKGNNLNVSEENIVLAYDISINVDKEKYQPTDYNEEVSVNISNLDIKIDDTKTYKMLHIKDDGKIETIKIIEINQNEIKFIAKSFSTYLLVAMDSASLPAIGDYVNYGISYKDVYNSQEYSTTQGWRLLSSTDKGNGKFDVELISTGVPAYLSYYIFYGLGTAKWFGTEAQITEYTNNYYKGNKGSAGLLYNFESIEFTKSESTPSRNKGTYKEILGYQNSEDGLFKASNLSDKTIKVRSVMHTDITGSKTGEMPDIITDPEGAPGLFVYDNVELNTNRIYWLASPSLSVNYYLRLIRPSGEVTAGEFISRGVRPVVKVYDVPLIKSGEYWELIEPAIAYAVYSETDNSLRFYNAEAQITEGSTYNDLAVTKLYALTESSNYTDETSVPWNSFKGNILTVKVEDEITPTSTAYWFKNLNKITNIDLTKLDTSKVTDMQEMFSGCNTLKSILVSNNFIVSVTNTNMFQNATNLNKVILTSKTASGDQFANASSQLGNITFYVPNDGLTSYKNTWSIDNENADKIKPILTLNGDNPMVIHVDGTYTEPGYKVAEYTPEELAALGSGNENLFGYNVTTTGNVITTTVGTYPVKYALTRTSPGNAITENVAEETRDVIVEEIPNYIVDGEYYSTLAKAYGAIKNKSGEIIVNQDVPDETSEVTIGEDYNVTLNLQTNKLTMSKKIINEGTLTIKGNGEILLHETIRNNGASYYLYNSGNGILNINDATINMCIVNLGKELNIYSGTLLSDGISTHCMNSSKIVNMYGGTIKMTSNSNSSDYALYLDGSTFNMYSGEIINNNNISGYGIYLLSNATFNMYGGTIKCVNEIGIYTANNSTLNVIGGTIDCTSFGAIRVDANSNLNIGTKGAGVSTQSPVIIGGTSGIRTYNSFNFYDGIIKGGTEAININDGLIVNPEPGYAVYTTVDGKTAYLKKNLALGDVTLSGGPFIYDEKGKTPTVEVTWSGDTLTKDKDFKVTYDNNTNAGTEAKVIITGSGDYTGIKEVLFTINKANITPVVTMNDYNYGSEVSTPSISGNIGSGEVTYYYYKTGEESKEWKDITSSTLAVGEYNMYAVVAGTLNYNAATSEVVTFEVKPATVTLTVSLTPNEYTYDGLAKTPAVTVKVGETPLVSGDDYTFTYVDNTEAGPAKVLVTGQGNYAGNTKEATFTINPAVVTRPTGKELTYNGQEQTGVEPGSNYIVTGNKATNAGKYTATATLPSTRNYKWDDDTTDALEIPWEILAKSSAGLTIELDKTEYTFDGGAKTPVVTVKDGEDTVATSNYTVTYSNNTNASTSENKAKVTVTFKENYTGTKEVLFTIDKAIGILSVEISGDLNVGKTISANVITKSDGEKTYQWWYTTDKHATSGTPIDGETSSTYTVPESMTGKYVGVTVNVAEGTNYLACETSNKALIDSVEISGTVKILGKTEYGEKLTVDTSLVRPNGCTFKYQWYYNDENSTTGGLPIENATNEELTIVSGLIGKYIYVEVTAEKEFYATSIITDITDAENNTSDVLFYEPPVIDLSATSGDSLTEITLTWTKEADVRYELYVVNDAGDLELLDNNVTSPYTHEVPTKNSSYEYFIYRYKASDPVYRAEGTVVGTTAFDAIYDEIIKDTTKPVIANDSVSATSEIIGSNSTVTVTFEATDLHYDYETSLESGEIEILVDGNKIENVSGELTKEQITSGERFTYVVTNITGNGTLVIRIPAGAIEDLATNTNDVYDIVTTIEVNQGDITRTTPTLETGIKEIKVTNTQTSSLEIAKIIYEYRISGDAEFITWAETTDETVTITGLISNTSYEVRTTVIDIADNRETSLSAFTTTQKIDSNVIEITQNPNGWTNQDVDVTIKWNDTTYIHEYSTNNTDWNAANESETKVTFTENGTLYVRLSYADEHSDVIEYAVDNIDKTKPEIGTITVPEGKANVTYIDVSDIVDEGGSGIYGYYVGTTNDLTDATWIELVEPTFRYTVTENDTYYVFVKDNAGNISDVKEVSINTIVAKVADINFQESLEVNVFEKAKPTLTFRGEAKEITFTIDNPRLADIDSVSGEVTGKIVGNTVIKVIITNFDGTTEEATCKLKVNPIEPELSLEDDTLNLMYGEIEKEFNYTYSGDGALLLSVSGDLLIEAYLDEENNKIIVNPIKAGTTKLVIESQATEIYQNKEFYIDVVVEKRPVTLEWTTSTFEYDGKEKEIIANVTDALDGDYVKVATYENNRKTMAGTYIAKALTLNNSNYTLEGSANLEKEWRIQRGIVDLELRMKDYSYGGRMQHPYVRNNPDNRTINYYYNTVSLNENGTSWSEVTDSTSLPVGTYYVYAVAEETTNYYETITEPVEFKVLPTELEVRLMQFGKEYDGKWTNNAVYAYIDISGDANVTAYQYKEEIGDNWIDALNGIVPIETDMNSRLVFRGVNPAGRVVTLETITSVVKLDKVAPVVENVQFETVNKMIEINVEAVDSMSGITSYSIVANEKAQREWKNITKVQDGTIKMKVPGTGPYYIYLKDEAGNISEKQTVKPIKDIIAPRGEITVLDAYLVEDNIAYTNKMQVTLGITAEDNISTSGDIQMAVCREEYYNSLTSEDQIVWEPYAETKPWTLTKENADERVYLILKDKAGNITEKSLVVR